MKNNYNLKFIPFLSVFILGIATSFGQITLGSDNAGNYTTWSGNNFGTGFTNWNLTTNTSGGGSAGHFIGNAVTDGFGNVNTTNKAFGMFGNPNPNNPQANAQRYLNNTGSAQVAGRSFLLPGQSFKIDLAIAFRNGYKGINFRDQNLAFLFNFNVESDQYRVNGTDLGWIYSQTSIFQMEVQQTDVNTYVVIITRGSDVYNSGNRTGQFAGIELYIGNTNAGNALNNLYFNNLLFQRCAVTTTWNGTSWTNGAPNINKQVAFTSSFTSSANIEACSISVSNGAVVTIAGGATPHTLTVENNITITGVGSKLIFNNNASLLQTNPAAVNNGDITFKRDATPMRNFEYTYWGSPVAGQILEGFSPDTDPDNYFLFNPAPATNTWIPVVGTATMESGKGYAIRAPESFDTTLQTFNGEFIGVPNNGNVPQSVIQFNPGILNYNLLSNPYPSAIDTNNLLDNSNLGALYFWTHNTAISNNVFTTDDYAIRTRTTSTAAVSGGIAPGVTIAAGQGFFASASSNATVTFTNTMRVNGSNSQFYRSAQSPQIDPLNYYIHLNLTNSSGAFKQIAVGYQDLATDGYDFGTDALASTQGAITFYSIIPPLNLGFGIQGRALPWGVIDQIPLGFNTTIAGDYTIAIDHFNPYFSGKNIMLEDTSNGTFHDLKLAPYNFTTAIGAFNSRFKLVYQNTVLNTVDFTNLKSEIFVYNQNDQIGINSTSEKIATIEIYNILGQLIFEEKNINQKTFLISKLVNQNQALIIKATLENGQTIAKKLIF